MSIHLEVIYQARVFLFCYGPRVAVGDALLRSDDGGHGSFIITLVDSSYIVLIFYCFKLIFLRSDTRMI